MAPDPAPPALSDRALQDLSFIRRTMEGAASFTDVPGWGLVGVGGIGLATAVVAARQPSAGRWLATWMVSAVVATLVGGGAMFRKLRRRGGGAGGPLLSVPARKFLLAFWPSILAGAVLTFALVDPAVPGIAPAVADRLLPGSWLLLYGLGVTTAGAFSVRAVPLMGLSFMALGTVTLTAAPLDPDLMLGAGFGLLQMAFGTYIARRHGG